MRGRQTKRIRPRPSARTRSTSWRRRYVITAALGGRRAIRHQDAAPRTLSTTVMQARAAPRRTFAAAYYCYCAIAVLRLLQAAPGSHAATVAVGHAGGYGRLQQRSGVVSLRFAAHETETRNKRWSTTLGGNTSIKNATGERTLFTAVSIWGKFKKKKMPFPPPLSLHRRPLTGA